MGFNLHTNRAKNIRENQQVKVCEDISTSKQHNLSQADTDRFQNITMHAVIVGVHVKPTKNEK